MERHYLMNNGRYDGCGTVFADLECLGVRGYGEPKLGRSQTSSTYFIYYIHARAQSYIILAVRSSPGTGGVFPVVNFVILWRWGLVLGQNRHSLPPEEGVV